MTILVPSRLNTWLVIYWVFDHVSKFNPWEVDFERISALKWKSHQIDHVTEQILFYKHYLMPICPILLNVTHFKYYKIIINCNKLPSVTQTLWHKFSDFWKLWESFFDPALSQSNVFQWYLKIYFPTKGIRSQRTAVVHFWSIRKRPLKPCTKLTLYLCIILMNRLRIKRFRKKSNRWCYQVYWMSIHLIIVPPELKTKKENFSNSYWYYQRPPKMNPGVRSRDLS